MPQAYRPLEGSARAREGFTPSERVAIGAAIEAELRGRVGNPNLQSPIVENFPPLETPEGQTRDLVAKATGFGKPRRGAFLLLVLALYLVKLPTECLQATPQLEITKPSAK